MAKAIIKKNNGGGLYQVETVYDRALVDSELKSLPDKIENARQAYLDAESDATDLLAEIAPLKTQLEYEKTQLEINEQIWNDVWRGTIDADLSPAQLAEKNAIKSLIGQYQNSIAALQKKISGLQSKYYKAQTASQKYDANYYARLTRQEQLEDFPENPSEALWCLDYTTDIPLYTEVGTIDMAGYAKHNGRNIVAGYKENYLYDMGRDGKLHHAFPGFNLMFSYLKFLTFNEGFQKWYPSTRYAVIVAWETQVGEEITELDYWDVQPQDKLAYIRYLPAYSAWLKNSIDPYPEDKHNVPISYMACNHQAFKINDVVLVKFVDQDIEIEKFKIRNLETSQTAIDLQFEKEWLADRQEAYDEQFGSYTPEQLKNLDTHQKDQVFNLTSDIIISESKISALEIRMEEIRKKDITFPDGWAKPLIIGFKDHPKPCPFYLYFMGDPILCLDSQNNVQEDCNEDETFKYYRVFDVKENLEEEVSITNAQNNALAINSICKIWGVADEKSGHGSLLCYRQDSIQVDLWTAHAIAWRTLEATPQFYWAVCVDYNGEKWLFPDPLKLEADPDYEDSKSSTWPKDDGAFFDQMECNEFIQYGTYNPVHAFDLWELGEDIDSRGWVEGDVCLSICGNSDALHIWNLTQEKYWLQTVGMVSQITSDYPDAFYQSYHTYILGVREASVHFVYGDLQFGKMTRFNDVYTYDAIKEEYLRHNISGHLVLWNPFRSELWYVSHGEISDPESFTAFYSDVTPELPGFGSNCEVDCLSVYHGANYIGMGAGGSSCLINNYFEYFYPYSGSSGKIEGYFGGHKYTNLARRGCNCQASWLHCGGNCYGTCYGLDIGTWYFDWAASVGVPDYVSITNDGSGETREVDVWNGEEGSVVTTQKTHKSGNYDSDYAQSKWPYIAKYAWLKTAIDSTGTEYKDIVIQRDINGDTEYGEGQEYFFTVSTDYGPKDS